MGKTELLRIEGLRLAFADRRPVDGVSFSISQGEFISLVGASGSGKTLTALAASGLLPPEAVVEGGSILLNGRELLGLPEKEWRQVRGRQIAMIFQEPMTSLNPVMNVGAQLAEAVRTGKGASRGEALDAAVGALREVHVPDPEIRMRAYPHQLSGGLRQRVMIAMALACRPSLLIADEPTTALDVTVQAGIVRLLRRIREERDLAVLLITHDIALAAEAGSRIVVMQDGRTIEEGPVERVISNPGHPYTVGLIERCRQRESYRGD
jgi:ABC-type dipeptide/oligopeptide/nickel transport system ATPase component